MTFDEATRAAAVEAEKAVNKAMIKYKRGDVTDEDDLTGVLIGQLDAAMEGEIGGLTWSSRILRHRKGVASEENVVGADLLLHVEIGTPTQKFSKGVLVQSKRSGVGQLMPSNSHRLLIEQCNKMLSFSAASYVFSYAPGAMRCGSATKIAGSVRRDLFSICGWTSYRFFLEFFRCPVGDVRISSTAPDFLPVPVVFSIYATGDLTAEMEHHALFR